MATLSVEDIKGVTEAMEAIGYYLTARLMAKAKGVEPQLPPGVQVIADAAAGAPSGEEGGEEGHKRARGAWTDTSRAELVKLADDAAYREATLGKEGNRAGLPNWAAMARHLGFSGTAPLLRQYKATTGKEPPHAVRAKKEAGDAEGGAPPAKKAKTADGAAPSAAAASAGAGPSSEGGWTPADVAKLVKLVEDEVYRKEVTGKRHLKWSRVAAALVKGKKESKKKYTAETGKTVED